MPLYDYECPNCGLEFEEMSTIDGRHNVNCPSCKSLSKLVIKHYSNRDWFQPHWNENFDLDPVYVRSRSHMKELCKDYGVYSRALGPIDDRRGS